jgi:hypothetical protein
MDNSPKNASQRRIYWLAIAKNHPPEWLASYIESPQSRWAIVTENGPANQRERNSAYIQHWQDAPYWAFALAKSYLDDVGEWPLTGIKTELTLANFEELLEQDGGENKETTQQAIRDILDTVKPVWPELDVVFSGEEKS